MQDTSSKPGPSWKRLRETGAPKATRFVGPNARFRLAPFMKP